MLKLNNNALYYAIKPTNGMFAYTRSTSGNITEDKKMLLSDGHSISAWFCETKSHIIKDLKMCGFSEFDQLKAKQYMGI